MRAALLAVVCGLLGLAGCSSSSFNGLPSTGVTQTGARLSGAVHGGQQPIAGAHLYLMAAGTTGYGGAGIPASSSNASVSLLTSGSGSDALGTYVSTAADGSFSITGDYTCIIGQQVYLYALGGNPGAGTNAAAGLMAVLGSCPSASNFLTATPYILINEVSTVAAAYAFAGFATDATHVGSSGTPLALTGIGNAFATAADLETLSTGLASTTTRAGNGTVPQTEINSLANILASCVDSTGAVTGPTNATPCYTLFTNALASGTTGISPTDTATAAINIAHNPSANIAALYALSTATPPFAPGLSGQPNDFTVALAFASGGLNIPDSIAIDGSGNAWITCRETTSVAEFSNSGAILSGPNGYSFSGPYAGYGIAIDESGNAWVQGMNTVYEFSNTGSVLSGANGFADPGVGSNAVNWGVAIDRQGNVWIAMFGNGDINELSSTGAILSGVNNYSGGGLNGPDGLAIDSSGNIWASNFQDSISEFTSSGVPITSSSGYTSSGLSQVQSLAIDSSDNVWVVSAFGSRIAKFTNAGVALTSSSGFTPSLISQGNPITIAIDGGDDAWVLEGGTSRPTISELSSSGALLSSQSGYLVSVSGNITAGGGSVAVDGSGNVWAVSGESTSVTKFIGVATPVVTPLAIGVRDKALGMRP